MNKIQSPAVFSGKIALKKALEMKSFMHEKVLSAQVQSQVNEQIRQQKKEEQIKTKEAKTQDERKIAQKVAKETKEKATNDLAQLLK